MNKVNYTTTQPQRQVTEAMRKSAARHVASEFEKQVYTMLTDEQICTIMDKRMLVSDAEHELHNTTRDILNKAIESKDKI